MDSTSVEAPYIAMIDFSLIKIKKRTRSGKTPKYLLLPEEAINALKYCIY